MLLLLPTATISQINEVLELSSEVTLFTLGVSHIVAQISTTF